MIERQVMQFLVPLSTTALQLNDSTDRTTIPLYVNPENVTIQETKLINKTLTKGGFLVQYWGEDLPRIQASGTTASGGIEAINILRDIYRHEQLQFERILLDRAAQFQELSISAIEDTSSATAAAGIRTALDSVLDGGFTSITDGISSTIDAITNAFEGTTSSLNQPVELIPTLAAFAISIDLYFQGEKFRGYFNDFQVTESAQTPGHFNYTFNFDVIKRTGTRSNFMPWHRNPRGLDDQPRSASIPIEGPALEELSFPTDVSNTQQGIIGSRFTTTTFTPSQDAADVDVNNVGVNRFNQVKS